MSKKIKKFRDKYAIVPLNPIMPQGFNAKKRRELRIWEQKIIKESKLNNEDIGKEPGE